VSAPFLSCWDIVKRFGTTAAVDGVDLDVAHGEILALLGPSGCGKTTLLRLIAGFEAPTAGTIALDGRLLCGPHTFTLPEKRRVAMVFQDFALFPHMNVAANIAFGLKRGSDKRRRIAELLTLVGLEGLERRLPHQLSGGQQQRVALARALASEPILMLLDEPFSNLDPAIRARVRGEVKQLIRQVGITALFVTHDQEEALSIADRVAVMMDGRVIQVGTPEQVYARPLNRAVGAFVGDANFLPGRVCREVADCELGRLRVIAGFEGPAEVMIRAESLTISDTHGVPAEVVSVEYVGYGQMIAVRLTGGALLRIRRPGALPLAVGMRVAVAVEGEVLAFPGAG
jgi:iron(III) transport system ATP-binding protein